ncbi:hypothetical protein CVU37_03825 [candidate division BRC1 bacterium HGW-BRC1-1]|nr:MAG: hypothetical protein CVU37_03825 [candidate division BRC1 bacterium HGW-BRC1-1]
MRNPHRSVLFAPPLHEVHVRVVWFPVMIILSTQGLAKTHGLKLLFSDLSMGIEDRERVGLIGVNGCGKSTLLKVLAGVEEADAGTITTRTGARIEYVDQNPVFAPGQTILEFVFSSASRISHVVREYERACAALGHAPHDAQVSRRMEEASRAMDAADAWDYEHQARALLGKLGVFDLDLPVDQLSGGYRKRVALAHALLAESDLLILDEPTNHLDADTVAYLEEHLRRYTGAVILVTHDRYFLDRVTDRIIELDAGQLRVFQGNFSDYITRKAEMDAAEMTADSRRLSILRNELVWLKRGARARTTKQKARIDRIRDMQEVPTFQRQENVAFTIETRRLGGTILELDNVSKTFEGKTILSRFTHTFARGERLGIIGPNGSGKTTLANLMSGRLSPDEGTVVRGKTVLLGYFDQESSDLDPNERALDYVKREGGDMLRGTDGTARSAGQVMEQFNFTPQMLYTPIERLSGGERRRLYLVRTLMANPNFLILDEPANDLDIPTLQALEDFLDGFTGCLVVISHDRYFLDRTIDQLLVFGSDASLRRIPGNFSVYEQMREDEESEISAARKTKTETPSDTKATSEKTAATKSGKLGFNEARELTKLELDIPRMEKRLEDLVEEMATAATDYMKLNELAQENQHTKADLETALERWMELSERS